LLVVILLGGLVTLGACARSDDGPGAGGSGDSAARSTDVSQPEGSGLVGRVTFEGERPKPRVIDVSCDPQCSSANPYGFKLEHVRIDRDGNLANVVVYLKGVPSDHKGVQGAERPTAILDQVGCRYTPHVLTVQLGQEVRIRNSDPGMHNVRFSSKLNGDWNITQSPDRTDGLRMPFTKAEVGTAVFKCDIHPWMKAVTAIFDHPYFAVSAEDGTFHIATAGLPDGTYEVRAWHEKYKWANNQKVTVEGGKAAPLAFTFIKAKKRK